jgi:hypothetical protein
VDPNTFKAVVGALLAVITIIAFAPWGDSSGSSSAELPPRPPDQSHDQKAPPGYYPPAPSTAVGITPEWRRFADNVDRICAISFNYALAVDARTQQIARAQGWSDERWEAAVVWVWAQEDARILRATARLGPPPERPELFARWRANVARRAELFREASRAAAAGRFDLENHIHTRIHRLKVRSDRIGQHFGLRICTSN